MVELVLGIMSWCIIIVLAQIHNALKFDRERLKERDANIVQFEKAARRQEDKRKWGR